MSTSQYYYSQATVSQKALSNDTFKFLVSTDNHLGYKETHSIRKNDSFDAFEEVLQKAKDLNVDFLLLGGDLFHDLNPSQESLYKCLKILKEKIFGDKQIDYETFWEDQAPNYSNENMNISLPIFIIHGNHDYPSNEYGNLSTLDLLHAGNYVNYFGKFTNYDNIEVKPILFHKKGTKIALYGLGHIKDVRLHYLLQNNKIKFSPPEENPHSYFHILVLHQNRYKGMKNWSLKNCIHAKMLPSFLNLIIWAHEHESLPDIEQSAETPAYIYQPGSSVATSLIEAECKEKHAGLFTFRKNEFYFEPVWLKLSARSLIFKQIELSSLLKKKQGSSGDDLQEEVEKFLEGEIEGILGDFAKKSQESIEKNEKNEKKEKKEKVPLVRLKIEYSGFDIIRIQRLEAKFKGRVANEGEILKFWKKKQEVDEQALQKNENLTTRFSECFRNKSSFNTLGSESLNDIRSMYEENLKKTSSFKVLNPAIFLEKVDNINFRNRQTLLADFFETGLAKINTQIFCREKDKLSKLLGEFSQKTGKNLEYLRKVLQNQQSFQPNLEENTRNLQIEAGCYEENLKKSLFSMISQQVSAVLKPESSNIASISEEIPRKTEKSEEKKQNFSTKERKSEEKTFDFDDEEPNRSFSTNISNNMRNPANFTINDQENDDDFLETKGKDYKINVFPAEPEENSCKNQKKRGKSKKSGGIPDKERRKPSKSRKKEEKKENSTKKPENIQKTLISDYLNPKKRKEDVEIKKPEKIEKKEEKIMNAEEFLGALLDKKSGGFQKQRVFANSPLSSKSKDKNLKDFF